MDVNFGTMNNIKHNGSRRRNKNAQSEFAEAKNSHVKVTFIFSFFDIGKH